MRGSFGVGMKEYVMTLTLTVALCSLSLILTPEGEKGIGGYTRLVASLCILSVTISPVASFIESLYELDISSFVSGNSQNKEIFEEIYGDMLCEANEKDISEGIEELLCRDFSISRNDIRAYAELYLSGEEYKLRRVTISLSGGAIAKNPHEIKEYVTTLLSCECEIVYT